MDAETVHRSAAVVTDTLAELDLQVEQVGESKWMTMLTGEWKRTIPVLFAVGDRSVRITSLLSGRPDENHDQVHELLLHRNQDTGWVHFALDDDGNVLLTGRVPHAAVSRASLDEVLGEVLAVSDATFNSVLRAGFEHYIDVEQRWRAANDMPPNPVSTEG